MLKIKPLHDNFIKPEFKLDSAGLDIYLQEDVTLTVGVDNVIKLGFSTAFDKNYVGLLLPRSSSGIKGISLRNTVGVIDSDYRGEWIAHVTIDEQGDNAWGNTLSYKRGDRILQCIFVPCYKWNIELVDELEETSRGTGGFGSTN